MEDEKKRDEVGRKKEGAERGREWVEERVKREPLHVKTDDNDDDADDDAKEGDGTTARHTAR